MTETAPSFDDTHPYAAADLRDVLLKSRAQGDKVYNFGGNIMGKPGMEYAASQITEADDIHVLNFSTTELTDDAIPALLDIIHKSPNLFILKLNNNHITAKGLQTLADGMDRNNGIARLEVSTNPLGPSAGPILAGMMRDYPYLTRLSALLTKLGDDGLRPIADELRQNYRIQHVDLNKNDIGKAGAEHFIEAIRYNRALTHVHLVQDIPEVNTYLSQESGGFLSPNLIEVSPENNQNRPMRLKNKQAAEHATKLLAGTPDLHTLNQDQLLDISVRDNAIFSVDRQRLVDGAVETKRETYLRYETFMRGLPKLPPAGEGFGEALFTPDENGFAPLDNPRLYRAGGIFLDRWQQSGLLLTEAFLSRRTTRGSNLLEVAAKTVPGERLVPFLNKHGVQLGAKELLNGQNEPTPLLRSFIEFGYAPALFCKDNWAGKEVAELRRVYQALPPAQQQIIGIHSLQLQLLSQPRSNATGR